MNKSVESYFLAGCGRCSLGGTPECKVHSWNSELHLLRSIIQENELVEECKWGVPCYTFKGQNVLLISAFKHYCSLSFFKGVLLKDEKNLLVKPGEHSQAVRLFKFTSLSQIEAVYPAIKAYILESIEIEKLGKKVQFSKTSVAIPDELQEYFEEDPSFKMAFESLTPGRQRGYLLYFSEAKQSITRVSRIEKYFSHILKGEGMNDHYKRNN